MAPGRSVAPIRATDRGRKNMSRLRTDIRGLTLNTQLLWCQCNPRQLTRVNQSARLTQINQADDRDIHQHTQSRHAGGGAFSSLASNRHQTDPVDRILNLRLVASAKW